MLVVRLRKPTPYITLSFLCVLSGVILETEGSVRKNKKRTLFHYSNVKKGTPNLTFWAASGSWTQL